MNTAVNPEMRRIVHARARTPKRAAALVLVKVQFQHLIGPDGNRVCGAALARRCAALLRGISPMGTAPVARSAIAALLHRDDVTRHVEAGDLEGRRQAGTEQRWLSG